MCTVLLDLNKHPIKERPRMTYILGSRCLDGVVLISDTKFTSDVAGITFTYDNKKIFAGISGVIMGFSGTRGKFELFQTAMMDYIEISTRCNKIVTRHQFLLRAFELTQKYKEFEILIGMTGNPSTLQRMYEGGIETINSRAVIGTVSQLEDFY